MSSRKRRDRMQHGDAFSEQTPTEGSHLPEDQSIPPKIEDFANMLYGTETDLAADLRRLDAKAVRVKNVPIDKVRPDPAQARRVMPAVLRAHWLKDPASIHDILQEWLTLADAEAERWGRPPLDVPALLDSDPENNSPDLRDDGDTPDMGPIENDFRALLQLAASIRHHGLANPITVVAGENNTFWVETGERRFLAYNLLQSLPGVVEGDWSTIPARMVESKSVWRQAAENGARQDLNAISLARQLALLLIDIYSRRHKFAAYEDMPGVDWYAQVADAKKYPIPYGRGAELAGAMGLKSANQLRHYRQLLRLPNEVWEIADEKNWTEYYIRQMIHEVRNAKGAELGIDDTYKSVTAVTDSKNSHISSKHKSVTAVTDLWLDAIQTNLEVRDYLIQVAHRRATEDRGLWEDDFEDEDGGSVGKRSNRNANIEHARRGQNPNPNEPRAKTILKKAGGYLVGVDAESGVVSLRLDDWDLIGKIPPGGRLILTVQHVSDSGADWDKIIYEHFNPPEDEE